MVPAAEVELFYAGQSVRAIGVLDSGSTHTVFSVQFAEQLGLNVTKGQIVKASTIGGAVEFYLFEMEIALTMGAKASRFPGQIGFFAVRSPRNILGRILLFSRFEIGFKESRQVVHLRTEE